MLPAFDEFIISYKDKSLLLDAAMLKESITNNGIFRPTIMVDGKVVDLWKRTFVKDKALINLSFPHPIKKFQYKNIMTVAKSYGNFLGKEIIVG